MNCERSTRKPSSKLCPGVAFPRADQRLVGLGLLALEAALLAACVAPGVPASPPAEPVLSPPSPRVLKVAHRGGAGLAPENTLAAFNMGLAHGADFLELDIHMSKDGQLVVMHDALLERTTNASGEVSDYTAAELAALDASARYSGANAPERQPVPTLDQVLALAKGRAAVQIEIKLRADKTRYPGIEAKLVELLRAQGMLDDVMVLSFDFPTLQKIKEIEPRLKTCALISTAYLQGVGRGGPEKVAEEMAALGVEYVGVNHTWLSDALLAALTARGLQVGVWTVNDVETMRKFAAKGVAFITSDRPDLLRRVLEP